MAVYTEVPNHNLEEFIESYGLGTLLSYKGIAEGVENTNYVVHTDTGTYILTLYEKRVNSSDLPFFLGLMEFLAASGLSCPTPVRDKNNNILRELCERPAALITFLQGVSIKQPQPNHCYELGIALANFHNISMKFQQTRSNSMDIQSWHNLFDKFSLDADKIKTGLKATIQNELSYLKDNWPKNLPSGIIHADLFPDNVFFLNNKVSGLIDFYFSCYDMLSYDVAICLNSWCFEKDISFNITKAKALLRGYNSIRTLEKSELDMLPTLARGASMRFLLTRCYDWLHTSEDAFVAKKDPIEYLYKLHFHQKIKSSSEYGLDEH